MDLHAASRLTGLSSQLAKMGAFLCFVLACGILIASLAKAQGLEPSTSTGPTHLSAAR